MDDMVLKLAAQGGPVLMTLALIAFVVIKYLIPLIEKALAAHREDLGRVLAEGKAANDATIAAFRESQDRSERTTEKLIMAVTDKLGNELVGVRKDLDRLSDTMDGLRSDLSRKGG